MSSVPRPRARPARPKYYDLNLLNLPAPGLLSIFHRISGIVLFLFAIPLVLWTVQCTLTEEGFRQWQSWWSQPLVKVVMLGFAWAYLHHFFAGIRYLLLDLHIGIAKEPAQASAKVVLAAGLIATILIGVRLW